MISRSGGKLSSAFTSDSNIDIGRPAQLLQGPLSQELEPLPREAFDDRFAVDGLVAALAGFAQVQDRKASRSPNGRGDLSGLKLSQLVRQIRL